MTRRPLDVHAGPRDSADTMPEEEAERLMAEDAEAKSHVQTRPIVDRKDRS